MSTPNALQITTPSDREIGMIRAFNAPRELIFDAWTKPELLKRWLGRREWPMIECEIDLRVGGKYRYVWTGPNDHRMGMGGVYQEIVRPERIVATELFDEAWYPGEALNTLTLTEEGGKTILTVIVRYDSKETRDMVLKTGMADGVAEGYDRLDAILAEGV